MLDFLVVILNTDFGKFCRHKIIDCEWSFDVLDAVETNNIKGGNNAEVEITNKSDLLIIMNISIYTFWPF